MNKRQSKNYFKKIAGEKMEEAREMGIDVDFLEEDYGEDTEDDYCCQLFILHGLMKDD